MKTKKQSTQAGTEDEEGIDEVRFKVKAQQHEQDKRRKSARMRKRKKRLERKYTQDEWK
jgi:hypothetical protein